MSNSTINASLPFDAEGYLTQECPSCEKRFKIQYGKGSSKPLSFCPYCGKQGDAWFTQEQLSYFGSIAVRTAIDPLLERFKQLGTSSGDGMLEITVSVTKPPSVAPPTEAPEPSSITHFPCCGESVKLAPISGQLPRCIICGTALGVD